MKEEERKHNKEMRKFSKNLTQKKLMQAAIASKNDQEYAGKVAECFEWRCKRMQKKQVKENRHWQKVLSADRNYIMEKDGFKYMLKDLNNANKNIRKFKRGLSIFEDQTLCNQLLSSSNAPGISSENLRNNLKEVVLAKQIGGPNRGILPPDSYNSRPSASLPKSAAASFDKRSRAGLAATSSVSTTGGRLAIPAQPESPKDDTPLHLMTEE